MEPPEATSIKSMLNIAGILAIVLGLIWLLIGLWMLWIFLTWWNPGLAIVWFIFAIVALIISFLVFLNCRKLITKVNQRRYMEAKNGCVIWMILGFIFCWIIPGILILIAYLKFDELIRWGQPGQPPYPQPYGQPQQQYPPQQYPPQQYPPQQYPPQQPPPPQQPRY